MTAKQVWPEVVRDMLQRNETGRDKYNRYLQTNCPDDMLQHAYEEALDLTAYLKTLIMKRNDCTLTVVKPVTIKTAAQEIENIYNTLHRNS